MRPLHYRSYRAQRQKRQMASTRSSEHDCTKGSADAQFVGHDAAQCLLAAQEPGLHVPYALSANSFLRKAHVSRFANTNPPPAAQSDNRCKHSSEQRRKESTK